MIESGAVADGTTDNTAAFQKALDAAGQAGGGIVEAPAGRFRIAGNLSIPRGVTLQGTYRVPPTRANMTDKPDGTILMAYAGRGSAEGPPFIRLAGNNAAVVGLVVEYPEWKQSDVPPVPYPPCVASQDTENVGILDCCFLNPYEAINLVRAHRHLDPQRHRLPEQTGHLRRRVHGHRPHRERPFLAVRRRLRPRQALLQMGQHPGGRLRACPDRLALRLQHVLLRIRRGLQVLRVEGGQHQRELPRHRGRFVPPGGAGRAGAGAGTVDHQRRVRRAMGQHGFGRRRDRPEARKAR